LFSEVVEELPVGTELEDEKDVGRGFEYVHQVDDVLVALTNILSSEKRFTSFCKK